MSTVTINADQITTTDIISVILDTQTTTQQSVVDGVPNPSPDGVDVRNEIIDYYIGKGYNFDGELDCKLYFVKEQTNCEYGQRQQEIDDLINDGYEITNEQDCLLTFEKSGFSPLYIQLNQTTETVDNVVVEGTITESGEREEVLGQLISTTNEQDILDDGYTYEGIVDCKKTWSKEVQYCEFDNKAKTITDLEKKGYTLISDTGCQMIFSGTFQKCEFTDKEGTISQYEADGYTLISETNCQLHFQKNIEAITNETDVYAFFDTTSMQFQDGKDASVALQNWFNQYKTANPKYTGSLYIIPIYYERYVDYLDIIKNGTGVGKVIPSLSNFPNAAFNQSTNDWISEVGIYPPNFDYLTDNPTNPNWTPPTDVLMLAFVDEAQPDYHGDKPTSFTSQVTQPTPAYIEDFNRFTTNLLQFSFFKGVLYPIVRDLDGVGGALVLQAMAAIEGRRMPQIDINKTETLVDVSVLLTENPYEDNAILKPLKDFGWIGVYNKTSPASAVFNSSTFSSEINEIILSGGQTDTQVIDEYIDGEYVEYTEEVVENAVAKTKKEYVHVEGCEIEIGDPAYFEDASFTIGYSPLMGSWISYYSFIPNYYISLSDHFKTGLNRPSSSLWSHLLTNKSYQVFYGEKFPWIIEAPIKEQFVNKTLKDVEYYLDAKKYSGKYDSAEIRNEGFNKVTIYNNRVNSGELHLKPQLGLLSELSDYPNTISETQQEVLFSDTRGKHRFNYFFDRMRNDRSNEPMWKWDINQIHKELNPQAITFTEKETLDYVRGDWFTVRFEQDARTDLRYEFKWMVSSEDIKQ